MPNGDTNWTATDPKTGQTWTWDGKAWKPEGAVSRFEKGFRTSMGFSPTGGVSEDLSQIGSGFKQMVSHPLDSASLLASGLISSQQDVASKAREEMKSPDWVTKLKGGVRYAESGIPVLGPALSSAGDAFSSGNVAGAMGQMAPFMLGPAMEKGIPAVGEAASKVVKPVLREAWGVGTRDVESATKKAATREAKRVDVANAKVEKAKTSYSEAVQDALKKRAEASAKETAATTKQQALTSQRGPVYQRMNQMADDAQSHIEQLGEKVNQAEGQKWEAFNKKLDNPPVETQATVDAIQDAQKNILTGESLPIFRQILTETLQDSPKEFIDSSMGLSAKSSPIQLDLARRLYTKISRKLNGSELPKDVARALSSVQDTLDQSIARSIVERGNEMQDFAKKYNLNPRPPSAPGLVSFQDRVTGGSIEMKEGFTEQQLADKLAKHREQIGASEQSDLAKSKAKSAKEQEVSGGVEALRDYRKLQADWRRYRETFSDKDSPLRKIVEAKDPKKKLNPITGDTGARAIDYLGRYRDMGADPSKLGRIRAVDKALRELPSSGAKIPEMPEREPLPAKAEPKVPTPEQLRRQMLEARGGTYSGPMRRFELFMPPLYAFRMLMKAISQNPKFIEYLAREGKGGGMPIP